MGIRFRRRVKLFPGVHLNFSLSGVSTTIGVPGLSLNFGRKGTYLNTGIPGTGLYSRQTIGGSHTEQKNRISNYSTPFPSPRLHQDPEIGAIRTEKAETTTTEGLHELKKMLLECYDLRAELTIATQRAKTQLKAATILLVLSRILLLGLVIPWFRTYRARKKTSYEDMQDQLDSCFVEIDMSIEKTIHEKFAALISSYKSLLTCDKVWDVTSSRPVDQAATRSAASVAISRRPVKFGFKNIDIIRSQYDALHFENANGGDIYIYPAFVAIVDSQKKFGLLDIGEMDFAFRSQNFVEEETVPPDAMVTGYTWAKVNKNGTPDRRFRTNYQIPLCKYGYITLSSRTGLNEAYAFSSYSKSEKFASAMADYQEIIRSVGRQGSPKSKLPRPEK
jgi:hypothetical protein